ncbi:DNA-directed DNA polymerase I [Candidatus Bathyarchaeota archaeon]|nr:DNA-directed DNA polymerase I [Candidatus Bathyarchaeota archaeon]
MIILVDAFKHIQVQPSGAEFTLKVKLEDYFNRVGLEFKDVPSPSSQRIEDKPSVGLLYLLTSCYDGERKSAYLKLYDSDTHRIVIWFDDSGHKPYCLSNLSVSELESNQSLMSHPGLDHLETVVKYDALRDQMVSMTKIVAKDPLSIGGRPTGTIREIVKSWEADIKYVENYIYDRNLEPGMPYRLIDGRLLNVEFKPSDNIDGMLDEILRNEPEDYKIMAKEWVRLLEYPVPSLRRVSVDIEVHSPIVTRMPDAHEADYPVICAGALGTDGVGRIMLLKRDGVEQGDGGLPPGVSVEYYDEERDLLKAFFDLLMSYPLIVTFNGDDFDLRYLWNRAQRIGFSRAEIPIEVGRDSATLKSGIHIDLYKFFFNRSVQVYAFSQKYREKTLDEIGSSLLNMTKKPIDSHVSKLTYSDLASYCYRDAEITLNLTRFDDDLVMKLIMVLSRISYMGVEDVTRQGVSSWIRSLLYREHRRRGYLIPRQDEIALLKGGTATEAVIKGKKYKGAMVVSPVSGVHFNVSVLDFASLYPSIIKLWNLGYETMNCTHTDPKCRSNIVPGTPHWVCKRRRALESLVIGSLRDLRVRLYKPRVKDKSLPASLRSWYRIVSDALKVILNASYGVFGSENFSLYCPTMAEATAAVGRFIISNTIKKAEELGIKVFYGDTDSIFLDGSKPDLLNELIEWSRREVGLELEVDKNYRYVALSLRKKNYLGVQHDGTVDIKGLTGKKRHTPRFLKAAFYELIDILGQVRSMEDFESAKGRIREIVKNCYLKLKNRGYSLEDLAFNVMIGKPTKSYVKTTPQHVKAAKLLERNGLEVKGGDLVAFVKVVGDPGVKPVQLANINEIDLNKYVEYIDSTFEQVLDALGLDFAEIIGETKLEAFFQ